MKISNIAKILPIALALSICGANAEFAADAGSSNATVNYSLTLNDFVKITTAEETNVVSSGTSYNTDYGSVKMAKNLAATFKVISNAEKRKVKLAGTCPGGTNAIKHVSDTTFELVFGNSSHQPTADAVNDILNGATNPDNNANAISFLVTLTPTREQGPDAATKPIFATEWDTDHIAYTIQNGHTTFAYTVAQDNEPNTFNTQDMDGTYTATITMTDLGQVNE